MSLLLIGIALTVSRPAPVLATGAISLTMSGSAYTQDFDTLAATGLSSSVPNGWDFSETGTNANTTYTAFDGSSNAGDTYSFGAIAQIERAFGSLRSGTLIPVIGAQFTNNTGSPITSLGISYTGEQWRVGQGDTGPGPDRLDFQLSTDATSLSTGTWTDYNSLDFSSPTTSGVPRALDGNTAANRTAISSTITSLSIANATTFWIRWVDADLSPGADDGLGVDEFSLAPNAQAAGQLCTSNAECASTHCADGVCCISACACGTCDDSGSLGTCIMPDPAGSAGNPSCTPYLCDGISTECPIRCGNDDTCITGDLCNSSDMCVPKAAVGSPCAEASMCASGFCADGVCCDSACTTTGFACNVQGSVGRCRRIVEAPLLSPWGLALATLTLLATALFALRRRERIRRGP